tara:strand:- start:49459 stop:50502 length:1044 start_codon:yes stop_codon:yes gene_type:complete
MMASAVVPSLSWADAGNPSFLAAAKEADGGYALFGLDGEGADLFRVGLPARGHAGVAHPHAPEAVAFARRPGTFALVIDCVSGKVIKELHSPKGRHFYGHGTFVADGDILCTAENDFDTVNGVIGLWSRSEGYRRVGEIPSHGLGPHEILTLTDDLLVIANGGIETHPDHGRDKLNIPTMQPSLTYVTPDGVLRDKVELPPELHKNSIRHIAARDDGLVGFAMQWQGEPSDAVPLLGLHRLGAGPARLAQADLGEQLAMQGYAGSVAFSGDDAHVGITSPVGGRLHIFSAEGDLGTVHRRADICGLARGPRGFMATDGQGGIWHADSETFSPLHRASRNWDNHVVAL